MRTLTVAVVVVLAACRGAPAGLMTGEATPEAAVTAFLGAAKAQDLQAMSAVWGTHQGSVRETMPRAQMEQREVVLIRLLCQDEFRIAGKSPGVDGRQFVRVDLVRHGATLTRRFTTVEGPGSRWYVENFEIDDSLQRFCR